MQLFQPIFSVLGMQTGVVDMIGLNRTTEPILAGECVCLDAFGSNSVTITPQFGAVSSSWVNLIKVTDAINDGTTLAWFGVALADIPVNGTNRVRMWGAVDQAFVATTGAGPTDLNAWTRLSPKVWATASATGGTSLTPDGEAGDIYVAWVIAGTSTVPAVTGLTTTKVKTKVFIDGFRLLNLGAHA